jgi:ubiquinone/menaquinone biosynthesis C-methylase UbiE
MTTTTLVPSAQALERAGALLRYPGRADAPLPVSIGPDGFVETLPADTPRTIAQRSLDTRFTAWGYDRLREHALCIAGFSSFAAEVSLVASHLQPARGDVVLDLACGQGNFTVEWARRVGSEGLVLGVDYSRAMLRRAVSRVGAAGLTNIVLIHGDAHRLPLATNAIKLVNCSGGFHAFPNLPRALAEIARVSVPGATLTASSFAERPLDRWARQKRWMNRLFSVHFVPLDWLGEQLEAIGYHNYEWIAHRGGIAYTSATLSGSYRHDLHS